MFSYEKHISNSIIKYVISKYPKLDLNNFVLGDAPFNCRCHLNSVQKIKEGIDAKVILCFATDTDGSNPCVHFINLLPDGKFQDNTWGWTYIHRNYYLIREVNTEEYNTIWEVLYATKDMLIRTNSNKCLRWAFNIITDNII